MSISVQASWKASVMSGFNSVVRTLGYMSAAVGASFASTAHAGPISTVPAGFTPVTIMGGTQPATYDIDLDGDGQTDLRVTGGLIKDGFGQLDSALSAPNNSAVFPLVGFGSVQAFVSPSDFTDISGIGGGSNNGTLENFSAATPYGEIGLIENAAVGQIGYIEGVANAADGSFLLQDFGLIEVPEPASLSLLAAGAVGVAAFRRRRAIARST